jgi:nicotinate-nucleotide adenylyltransferase
VREHPLTKIGIFPGSFDPVHEGHIAFACAVGKQFNLDKIFFLVEPRPHRKQGVRALAHRIAMTQAAIKNDPHLGVIVVEESRFAVDSTWSKITARFPDAELFMIMGEATLHHIVSWPQIAEYVDAAPQFVIGVKDDSSKLELQERLYILQHTKAFPFLYHLVPEPIPSIRSRNIRANIRRGKISAAIALPVADYIKANQLYHG